jgi:transposase-like protein
MSQPITYKRHRFPPEIIAHAVWLYFRFPLSLRLVEEMLLERGIVVSYETIRRWGKKFGPEYARRLRRFRRKAGLIARKPPTPPQAPARRVRVAQTEAAPRESKR